MSDPYAEQNAPRRNGRLYPGAWPPFSCVVTRDEVRPLEGIPAGRRPVLAIGSNASPAQLRAKYADAGRADALEIAMSRAQVEGLHVGFCPWRAFYGAHPATVVLDPDARTELMVQWLTQEQVDDLDATELPAYERVWLAPPAVRVSVDGEAVDGVWAYVAVSGPLLVDGVAVRMVTPWGDVAPGPMAAASQDELDAILARA